MENNDANIQRKPSIEETIKIMEKQWQKTEKRLLSMDTNPLFTCINIDQ